MKTTPSARVNETDGVCLNMCYLKYIFKAELC